MTDILDSARPPFAQPVVPAPSQPPVPLLWYHNTFGWHYNVGTVQSYAQRTVHITTRRVVVP